MKRKTILINKEKCNGCGLCETACHEGAIKIIDKKAVLASEELCDGLGDCLPACPQNAISFVEKEIFETIAPEKSEPIKLNHSKIQFKNESGKLSNFPVQLKLVPVSAPYFSNCNLLVAADCTAFSYGNFHEDFIKNRITLIGCTKLDSTDYLEKLTAIFKMNSIKSVTVARMEVPCCSRLEKTVKTAILQSGKAIPLSTFVIGKNGNIL